jgi:hypothetical protein
MQHGLKRGMDAGGIFFFLRCFLKVLALLEYKKLKRAVSFEEHAHWQGKEAHGDLTYRTVM